MYFTYPTTSLVKVEPPDIEITPSVSFCIRYVDILNRTKMEEDNVVDNTTSDKFITKLTIKNIFKYTPLYSVWSEDRN